MKKMLLTAVAALALTLGGVYAVASKPTSVIHVVTVKWKPTATPEQIAAAVQGVETVGKTYKGITRAWTKTLKVQGAGYTHAFVMEFKDEKALKDYTDSPAQKKWYEVYLPIREQSTTHDITN